MRSALGLHNHQNTFGGFSGDFLVVFVRDAFVGAACFVFGVCHNSVLVSKDACALGLQARPGSLVCVDAGSGLTFVAA